MDEFEQSDLEKETQMTLTTLAIKMQYIIKKKKILSREIANMVYFLLSLL